MVDEDEMLWRERFSTRVKTEMKKQKLKQWELAEDSGINQSSLCYYLNCKKTPTFYTVMKISESLNVRLDEFV